MASIISVYKKEVQKRILHIGISKMYAKNSTNRMQCTFTLMETNATNKKRITHY